MPESRARRIGRWTYRVAAALLSVAALGGAVRLVAPATVAGPTGDPPGVRRQLTFLRDELSRGAAEQAQREFPEGYFFAYTLYGLTWVELGQREPDDQRAQALREARWALSQVDGPAGRTPFSPDLTPAYGVFYRGWTNWLRGGVLSLQPARQRDPVEVRRFDTDSADLGAAFDASASPYLTAYPDQAWPVDSTVAVASLRLHDALRPPRYGATVTRWLGQVRQRLDPATGLMPHRVDPVTGTPIEVARGSSQSVIQRFLVDIDPTFAREQYLRFRDRYVVWPLGLGPGVREYPSGTTGPADVDSGPLPLGVSLSATVVTLGAAQVEGDGDLSAALGDYAELVGVPVDTPWTKRYAFGLVPVGDAFLAWSKTARPWVNAAPGAPGRRVSWWWRVPLLAILAAVGLSPWIPGLVGVVRRQRQRREPSPEPTHLN